MEKGNIKLKLIDKNDFKNIQFLYNTIFEKDFPLSYFEKKYNTDVFDCHPISSIAYDDDKPIAFYGGIPQTFQIENKQYQVAHLSDVMTLPAYQKSGVSGQLAQLSFEAMKAQGFGFAYGFPNDKSYHSSIKRGFLINQQLSYVEIKIPTLPLQRIAHRLGMSSFLAGQLKMVLNPYLIEKSTFTNPLLKDNLFVQDYHHHCLLHRSYTNQLMVHISGCDFWLKADNIIHVGAVTFESESQLQQAVITLKKLIRKAGYDKMIFHTSTNTTLHEIMEGMATSKPSWWVLYYPFIKDLPYDKLAFNYADSDTF